MRVIRLKPGNISQIMQTRDLSDLRHRDHTVGIGDLSNVWELRTQYLWIRCVFSFITHFFVEKYFAHAIA